MGGREDAEEALLQATDAVVLQRLHVDGLAASGAALDAIADARAALAMLIDHQATCLRRLERFQI